MGKSKKEHNIGFCTDSSPKIQILNQRLIKQQGLDESEVDELIEMHGTRVWMFDIMADLNPDNPVELAELKQYVKLMEALEFNMQRVWKFKLNNTLHTWWCMVPHCQCPTMDNHDPAYWGGGHIVTSACPLHWDESMRKI